MKAIKCSIKVFCAVGGTPLNGIAAFGLIPLHQHGNPHIEESPCLLSQVCIKPILYLNSNAVEPFSQLVRIIISCGHIYRNTPDPVRSPKLSR